ncbi:Nst1p [Lachancea thermotolerans CBS 6340]|uniref:Stress response protein NST1 n=1 Tax=Lachancea thermotolerans (strain ATCC 56472 / CBS 6340 / NRRL Y-8284) TaxID=559295 RepID=C5DME8_LACTC|nr:KLTH0G08250p [Lachancea thermotolerans CBS 6340]CAR24959.1 KLTH0G08250p [Lachancea thermotolerans CBS 6340]
MGKKRQGKKISEPLNENPTVVSGSDVHFDFSEENMSASTKKKMKNKKKNTAKVAEAEIYDSEAEYPSSRVIKRAPNGDVIVETLAEEEKPKPNPDLGRSIPTKLDSHWESLSSEEKKRILRIEKNEVFEVIKNYQSNNNCNCSVCGRRNVAMEQELEQIYNRLYDSAKQTNSDTDFVLFHLNMIKELQRANATANAVPSVERVNAPSQEPTSPQYLEDMRDEAVKYCLSNKAVESLKEEVLQFKHNKQRQQQLQQQQLQQQQQQQHQPQLRLQDEANRITEQRFEPLVSQQTPHDLQPTRNDEQLNHYSLHEEDTKLQQELIHDEHKNLSSTEHHDNEFLDLPNAAGTDNKKHVEPMFTGEAVASLPTGPLQSQDMASNDDVKNRYMDFAKAFVSSHPKIAHEYVSRMMMYPDMRALTEDLMYNNGQSFIKAMEDYVVQKDKSPEQSQENNHIGSLFEEGAPLTPDQYANIQRHIAQGMTDRMNFEKGDFKGALEGEGKGLLEQFLAGEDPISMLLKSFTKQNGVSGDQLIANQNIQEEIDYDDEDEYDEEEYSDYEDEEESEYEDDVYEEENNNGQYHHHQYHHHHSHTHHHEEELELEEEEVSTAGNEEEYDSGIDEQERLEEGRRLIQIAITKLLQKKLVDSYHEKQAENNRLRLLQELEAEEQKKREKEEKKQRKREKEKEKKRAQQQAKEQERRKKEEEDARLKKEAEEREMQRREAQRQRVEEAKRKKDEERRKKLEEQRRKEEEQQKQKKLKEEQKRKREEEKRLKDEAKKLKEEGAKRQKEEDAKRQKEEELKKQKEAKKLDQERKRQQQEESKTQYQAQQKHMAESNFNRRQSTPPEAVPYGVPNAPFNDENHNDLFHMINEAASKSLSSSSSHLQTLLQPQLSQPDLQHPHTGVALSGAPQSNWQTSGNYAPPYEPLASNVKGLDNSWSSRGGIFQTSPSVTQPHLSAQQSSSAQPSLPQFAQFGNTASERKKSFNDELSDLTNFLSSTSLSGNPGSSTGAPGYNIPDTLWSSVDQTTHPANAPFSGTTSSVPPLSIGSTAHRKSIWENEAPLNPTNASPGLRNLSTNIWGDIQSNPNQVPSESLTDVVVKSYALLSREFSTDYVDVEKLYHTVFSLMKDSSNLAYSNFLGHILTMRATHNCDVVSNQSGAITHVKIPYAYLQSQQPQPGFLPSSELPRNQSSYKGGDFSNVLFDELYNGASGTMPPVQRPLPNSTPVTQGGSNQFSYSQPFSQSGTNNIWG